MNPLYILLALSFLTACAGPRDALVVKQLQLRDQVTDTSDEPMAKMEKERRLRGAVSMAERRDRLGQYYTLIWSDPAGVGHGQAELIFQYQQGTTASLVKKMTKQFPAPDAEGIAEFAVIGENYFKNGRVLAWKATLQRGKQVIATRQSYLWQ